MSRSKRTTRNTRRHTFKQTKLACAVSTALASTLLGGNALAQDQGPIEEVVVSGIRQSLERSMDMKRDAVGVVDAITAEDIGKFPDSNLAESLQRITGVSIDRRNGEGYQITVRGFGPQFNLVTLNGRTMPTSALNLSKSGGSNPNAARSFDMSNIAAEGVAGVEVYKTGRADISSGGIGATVNLTTRRPFDTEGFTATVGAKLLSDSTVRAGDDITPEYSAFASWSNDMFGASLAYTYQER
ncbi:MAG TPA: TonB-dependent receptor plug domain-containing protein, partial [Gammaproteobacteria bacterium]